MTSMGSGFLEKIPCESCMGAVVETAVNGALWLSDESTKQGSECGALAKCRRVGRVSRDIEQAVSIADGMFPVE